MAPTADDLGGGLPGYHLDFPSDALDPGCEYEEWSARLAEAFEPAMYARVVAEGAYPFALALQYWFFYPYNDFNNKHEGDWEMIQLVFDAASAQEAVAVYVVTMPFVAIATTYLYANLRARERIEFRTVEPDVLPAETD